MQWAMFCPFWFPHIPNRAWLFNSRIDYSCLTTLSACTVKDYFTFGLKLSLFSPGECSPGFLIPPKLFQKSTLYGLQYFVYYVKGITSFFLELIFVFPSSKFLYFVHPEKLYFLTKNSQTTNKKIAGTLCLAICLAGFHNDVLMVLKCC